MSSTEKQKHQALAVYDGTGSVTKTIARSGYPARQTLYHWTGERNCPVREKTDTRSPDTPGHPRHPPLEAGLDAIKRCFEDGEDVRPAAEDIGYSRHSIHGWRRIYLQKGAAALMDSRDIPRDGIPEGGAAAYEKEIHDLKTQVHDMQMQMWMDIMQKTINVLKKTPAPI